MVIINIIIYDKKTTKGNFESNGLAVLNECIKCEVNEEQNGDYSLELHYPTTSKKAQYFTKYNIIKVDGQLFRIYKFEKEHKSNKIIYVWASHIFYDLAFDFIENISLTSTSIKSAMIKALEGRQFASVYTLDSDIVIAGSVDFIQINPAEAMFKIIETWKYGYLKRDNFDIKILISSGIDSGVLIKYGKNIQGIKVINDSTEIATKMFPVGSGGVTLTEKYITIADWNGVDYPSFQIIKKVEFNVADEPTLRSVAQQAADTIGIERTTIEVDFAELSRTVEYQNYKQLETVKVGDTVTLKHSELNLNVKVPVIRVTSDKLTGKNTKVQLGQPKKSRDDSAVINAALKTVKDDLGNQIAKVSTSMMYYANGAALTIGTIGQNPVYLGITAVDNTNLTCLISMYGVASVVCILTIQILLDNKVIPFTPKQKLQVGDNIIGIPMGIPQVGAGAHYLSVILNVDIGTFTIPIFNLQVMIDGRNLQGGLSSSPPHLEITQPVVWVDCKSGKNINQIVTTNIKAPINVPIIQQLMQPAQPGTVITSVKIALTKVAEESNFDASEDNMYNANNLFMTFDGTLTFITQFTSDIMITTSTNTGMLYSVAVANSSDFTTIINLEVF
ncbi:MULTISPECIES: phage tail spike protein [Clostridium]|uniref:Phage tail spike protein n=1 Tax=Clostridium frigoriphilum TaxID=443253 RepID=A0ABU7UQ22_9CLOT